MKNIISNIIKIITIVLAIQIIFMINNTSQASFWDDIFKSGDDFFKKGEQAAQEGSIIETEITEEGTQAHIGLPDGVELRSLISDLYNIIFPLGVVITVAVGGILGIKFMLASAEDKAKVKESLLPYGIGCAVIFGAFGIWKICLEILSNI